jgi:hypothetical protein
LDSNESKDSNSYLICPKVAPILYIRVSQLNLSEQQKISLLV